MRIPRWHPWVSRFARHTWFEVRRGEGLGWTRIELANATWGLAIYDLDEDEARADERWGRAVRCVRVLRGGGVREVADALVAYGESYEDSGAYRAWPGPNSNTFVARAAREIDGLDLALEPNAVGKDYAMPLRLGPTPSGTGVQVDTPILGAALAAREGVELHLLQLTFGLSLFPPALKIAPFPPIGLRDG